MQLLRAIWRHLRCGWCDIAGHDWSAEQDALGVTTIRCARCGLSDNDPRVLMHEDTF